MKVTELRNQVIRAEKGYVVGPPAEGNGQPEQVPVYKIECTDRNTGDVIWFVMDEALKDEILRQLTGGVVIAVPGRG